MNVFLDSYTAIVNSVVYIISSYVPRLVAGTVILLIGLVVASLAKDLIRLVFRYFRLEHWLQDAGLAKEREVAIWPKLISELIRWTIIFIFLMSAVDVWGIPKVADVLNQLLGFFPSVFVAIIIGWVGLIAARFSFDIVVNGVKGLGSKELFILGNIAKYSILFFTALIILTQLGVAAELVKILFTGIVGMLALAAGLAFGLGGQDSARDILKGLKDKVEFRTPPVKKAGKSKQAV